MLHEGSLIVVRCRFCDDSKKEVTGHGVCYSGLICVWTGSSYVCLKGQTLIQNKPSISEGYFSDSLEKASFPDSPLGGYLSP